MFQHCSGVVVVRASAAVPVTAHATLGRVADPDVGAFIWAIKCSDRSAGSYGVQAEGSIDGTTYYSLGSDNAFSGVAVDGWRYVQLSGAIPPYTRLKITPAGGFDGNIGVYARGSSFLALSEYATS